VHRSIRLYNESLATKDPARARRLSAEATAALRAAVQPAALAASQDRSWQALATTLSQTRSVGEGALKYSLSEECSASLKAS